MQWIEILAAGVVGLLASSSLILLILQANRQYGLARRLLAPHRATPAPASKWEAGGLIKIMVLVLIVLGILLESDFLESSERWWVITAALGILGCLVGVTISNAFLVLIQQASGIGDTARDHHHTHQIPVPRLGGIGLAGGLVTVVLVFTMFHGSDFLLTSDIWLVLAASLAMFGLGLWDDFFALGAKRKLFGQLLIASVAYFCGIGIAHFRIPFLDHVVDLGLWSWPVTVFWLVAMTNLINLIDGVDGLAGGISLALMVLLLYVCYQTGSLAVIAAGMIGALLGFLRFNFPPARIYMGDGGAYFLGFLIGCMTIVTSQKGTILAVLVAPLFVLALPIIDTSLAILRRGSRGLPLFRPDRSHIHHRLLALGYSRRKVVLGLYGFTAFFLLLGFATYSLHGQFFALILGVGVLTIIIIAGRFSFSREWFSVGRVLGNSVVSRADVHYGMCLTRWLALEGTRADSLEKLAEDAVLIAKKLGFTRIRIRLEDGEKMWQLTEVIPATLDSLRHELPGRKTCFMELTFPHAESSEALATGGGVISESTYNVLADLLAEGWSKAISDWTKVNQAPVCFRRPPEGASNASPSTPPPGIEPSFS